MAPTDLSRGGASDRQSCGSTSRGRVYFSRAGPRTALTENPTQEDLIRCGQGRWPFRPVSLVVRRRVKGEESARDDEPDADEICSLISGSDTRGVECARRGEIIRGQRSRDRATEDARSCAHHRQACTANELTVHVAQPEHPMPDGVVGICLWRLARRLHRAARQEATGACVVGKDVNCASTVRPTPLRGRARMSGRCRLMLKRDRIRIGGFCVARAHGPGGGL